MFPFSLVTNIVALYTSFIAKILFYHVFQGQAINFGEEYEDIMTEEVPEASHLGPTQNLRTTNPTHIVASTEDSYTSQTPIYSAVQKREDPGTIYIPMRGQRSASPQLRQTSGDVIRYEPVHVRASTESQVTRPRTGEDIVISPHIPAVNDSINDEGEPGIAVYANSDDEAMFTPNRQKDVLF